jgi:hypothetical protein
VSYADRHPDIGKSGPRAVPNHGGPIGKENPVVENIVGAIVPALLINAE